MRLAASNIGWRAQDDDAVAGMLRALGYEAVEVAPTRLWSDPLATSGAQRAAVRGWWERRGLRIVAMQALLFGRPDAAVFGTEAQRADVLAWLEGMIALGADLGAEVLVFGSPRNRSVAGVSAEAVTEISTRFFGRLGEVAAARGVRFCIEPNPVEYGCDFVTNVTEGLALVDRVATSGFGLHLDAAAMTASGEGLGGVVRGGPRACHFHASELRLAPIGAGTVDHPGFAAALRQVGYSRWVSVEMRLPEGPDPLAALERSLQVVATTYR